MGKTETWVCNCHQKPCDVRSWPEVSIEDPDTSIPTNHYFCRVTGDGTKQVEATLNQEDDNG